MPSGLQAGEQEILRLWREEHLAIQKEEEIQSRWHWRLFCMTALIVCLIIVITSAV